MIKTVANQKINLIISIVALIATIVFVVFDRFSFFSVFIGILNLFFVYLYQYRGNSEYLNYGLIFTVSYIFIYLYQFNFLNQWLSIVFLGLLSTVVFYTIFFTEEHDKDIKIIYSTVIFFTTCQITAVILLLQHEVAVKALFAILIYYLTSGIIKLYDQDKLNFYSVFKYSIVFFVGFLLLAFNTNYLI